jgi:hypothetical protein
MLLCVLEQSRGDHSSAGEGLCAGLVYVDSLTITGDNQISHNTFKQLQNTSVSILIVMLYLP